ncbi:hypothetical protein PV326_001803, partial [Microctonus aethiopoides]
VDVMAKWRAIRDNYIRSLKKQAEFSKSGSAAKKFKVYVYADQLGFLNKGRELRPTEASFENANEEAQETIRTFEGEQGTDDVTERDVTQQPTPPSSAINAAQKKTKKLDVERALINFMESHKVVKEPLVDEDLAFFHSLLPSLKTLDFEQKFTFRMETMQLLRSLKNSPTHANFTHSNINALSNSSTYVHQTTNSSLPIHTFMPPPTPIYSNPTSPMCVRPPSTSPYSHSSSHS